MLGQGDLRLFDAGMTLLLPLGAEIAVVALLQQQFDNLPVGHFALAQQDKLLIAVWHKVAKPQAKDVHIA